MAGFDDSNDIKITTSLDTEGAVKAAQDLKTSIESAIKATAGQFDQLQKASKQLAAVLKEQATKEVADTKAKLDQEIKASAEAGRQEVAIAQQTANQKVDVVEKAIKRTISAEQRRLQELKVAARQEIELEKTKRTQMLKDIAQLNKERAIIRKTPRAELPAGLGGAAASSKILKELEGIAISVGNRFGFLTVNATQAYKILSSFHPLGKVFTGIGVAAGAAALGVGAITASAFRLSEASGKLEGLTTGFQTLQQSVGRIPTESIEQLRAATQGLISDTELYQKANQAVLLQVPTKLFEESAEAAVKLGRAMGIDAAFALESLSIGLGRQSRLYLDNLGIVVSASEAYRNFAAENNKLVSELTESDKRLAFFNETSKKLKEALETLPPIQRTVGSEFAKIQASIGNLNAEFLKGFNENNKLAAGYTDLNTEIGKLAVAFKNFGDVYASVVAAILNNPISKLVVGTAVGVVNEISANLAAKFGQGYDQVLARARNDLKSAELDLAEFEKGRTSKLQQALGFDKEYYENRAEAARLTVDNIIAEQKRLESLPPVGIKTDTSELDNFASDFKSAIENIREKVGEDLGVIRIRGVDPEQVSKTMQEIAKLGQQIEKKKVTAEQASTAIANYANSLAESARAIDLADVQNKIQKLDKTSKDYTKNLAQLTAEQEKLRTTLAPTPKALDRINKVIENGLKLGKEKAKADKNTAKDFISGIKKQEKEFESFVKSLRRSLGRAIPDNFQKELVRIFNKGALSSKEFEDALIELGKKAQDAGVDMEAFKKEIADLQKLAEQGIKIEIDADTTKAEKKIEDDLQESLKRAQSGVPNIREMIYGKDSKGGGFFGFDTSELVGPETQKELQAAFGAETFAGVEAAIAKAIIDGLKLALRLAFEKFTRDDAPQIAEEIGTLLGGDIGGIIGKLIGENIKRNTQDLASTKERKNIDRYFSDLFDGERLAIVLEGQLTGAIDQATGEAIRNLQPQVARISDLTLEGMTAMAGNVDFGGDRFRNYFETLSSDAQAAFNGIGIAFGSLNGIATEQARLIGVALANNIGGSLQNLQVLIQGTGESFENLANAVLKSFLDAQLTIEEAYNALVQLQNLYQVGLPDALGDYEQAARNLFNILADDRPGRYAVDSLRDIGAEGIEAKKTFDAVIASLGQTFTFTAEQQTRLFEALRINGITSLAQLQAASDEQLLAILRNIELIRENATAPLVTAPQIPTTTTSAPRPSGSRRKSPEQEAREKLREETKKLLRESQAYLDILGKVTSGELAQAAAGLQIVQLQKEIEGLLKRRNDLEKKLNDELDKGSKANKQRLAKIAAELDGVNDKLEEFKKKAEGTTRVFKELDIKGVIPFIKDANNLGVIAKQIGVEFDKASSILVKGFLQGRLSLAELRAELDKTKETLGPGIPNAVGAVTDAFQNLLDAGTQGGQFSVDAFTDIFAEFREKFQTEGSALREAERKQLNENLRVARETLAGAVGPEATEKARKTLEQAKKTLDDFNASVAAPDLSDLRAQLEASFGREQIDKFFRALDESGLKTFEDFEKAGSASVVGILTKLESLGFSFNQTSQDIVDAQAQLIAAEKEANAGLDPMQEAINLIKSLNEGAGQLPPVFNATTQAIESLNGPLGALASGFDDILEKVAKLKGPFETDVVFNISTTGDAGGKALVEALFGDGTGTTQDILSTTSGSSESNAAKIAKWKKEVADLKRRGLNDRRRNRIALLQKRIAQLGG